MAKMSRQLEYTKKISPAQRKECVLDGFEYPKGIPGLFRLCYVDCQGKYAKYPFRSLVKYYAMMGLHRYNLLEGENFQLDFLKGFSIRMNCAANSFYITLGAFVPNSGFQQTFQVLVSEERIGCLHLTCPIARPQAIARPQGMTTKSEPFLRPHSQARVINLYNERLPDWPSEIAFNDRKRFYLLKESELRDTDWIRLYLQLVLVTCYRNITDDYLSQLEIVQVAIETIEDVEPKKTAIVYIRYKDLAKARISESLDRKAIVKRVINESTGHMTLQGDYWSGEKAWNTDKESMRLPGGEKARNNSEQRSIKLKRRLGVHKLWRLSNPRWHRAYKNPRRLRNG